MTPEEKNEIKKNYFEPLSLEDIRKILHISKRKASWLLQNGYILCENTGKKTRQYHILFEDLFAYMEKIEQGVAEMDIPIGLYLLSLLKSPKDKLWRRLRGLARRVYYTVLFL